MGKITATCAIFDHKTDTIISERFIGEYDTVDQASFDARKYRKDNECVCIYGAPEDEDEDEEIGALEMAYNEVAWNEISRFSRF